MAQDWVKRRMQKQTTKQQREQDDRIKVQHALACAQKIFGRLQDQIQKDVAAFHQHGGDTSLFYQEGAARKFKIRRAAYPAVTLDVELDSTTITYERTCKFDDTSLHETIQGSLRIWADLPGNVQIYKNGSPFLDDAEVSEFLLEPVFTYIG